jgi:hypothetical protein
MFHHPYFSDDKLGKKTLLCSLGKYGIRQTLKYQANSRDPAVQGWPINKCRKATIYSCLITKIKHKIIIHRLLLIPFNILE